MVEPEKQINGLILPLFNDIDSVPQEPMKNVQEDIIKLLISNESNDFVRQRITELIHKSHVSSKPDEL